MKKSSIIGGLAIIGLGTVLSILFAFTYKEETSNASVIKPNVIVIYADDLGWKELSYSGNTRLKTPNIDQISSEGTRFTQAYATAPICSPSRAALLTGRYQQRFGFEYLVPREQILEGAADTRKIYQGNIKGSRTSLNEYQVDPETYTKVLKGIPESEITIGEVFKSAGYATAWIGKWHLGETDGFYPYQNGFDYSFGFFAGSSFFADENDPNIISKPPYYADKLPGGRYGSSRIFKGRDVVDEKKYLTDKFADEAVAFIEKNKSNPFFLYLPFNAVHDPLQAKKSDFDQITSVTDTATRIQLALTKSLDDAIGRVNAKLKELGLDKNTIIFFSSDNGGVDYYNTVDNRPLKGGKLSHFEGGIRVPYFIKYPGVIPAGKTYDFPVSNMDIFATALAVSGLKLQDNREIDGVNLVPYVTGKNPVRPHEALFWRNGFSKAVRKGDWKLYVNERNNVKFLYDLSKDQSETTDLSKANPEKFKELQEDLKNWEKKLLDPKWAARSSTLLKVGNEYYFFPI